MNCLNCQKKIEQASGRRPKLYCSPKCRNEYWRHHHQKQPQYVQYATFLKVVEERDYLKAILAAMHPNQPNIPNPKDNPKEPPQNASDKILRHPLYKDGDPIPGTMAFLRKYNCMNYEELQKLQEPVK
jgi:hypothetical protein